MRDHSGLLRFLAERQHMRFAWGNTANDCISFSAGAILAQTGRDMLEGLPGWSTEVGAIRLARKFGGLDAAVSSRLVEVPLAHAHRGDVAGVADPAFPGGLRLTVIVGALLAGPGTHGIEHLPRSAMVKAWSASA